MQDVDILNPKEAAQHLKVSKRTLEAWRYRGGGPKYLKISARCIRYSFADLQEWLSGKISEHTSSSSHSIRLI